MKAIWMIFEREMVEDGEWYAYGEGKYATEAAAWDHVKNVLEPYDKEMGVYQPDFYVVHNMA